MAVLSVSDLKSLLGRKEDVFILDVRTREECGEGIIEGAVNIPVDQLKARVGEVSKGKKIVVICEHGSRSMLAANFLRAQGFDASNIRGGMVAWNVLANE